MNVSADQVRAATRVAAAVITADKVPPLRLDEAPGSHGLARRPRPARKPVAAGRLVQPKRRHLARSDHGSSGAGRGANLVR